MTNEFIADELFCLRFESETLAELLIHKHAERWVYKYMTPEIEEEHLARYQFALSFTENKQVLDIACGCGYGSYFLATEGKAASVTGVDLNDRSIRYANHRYPHPNIKRWIGDAQIQTFEAPFDVIICFETIEHLPEYEKFLANMQKALKPGGFFLVSTPIVSVTSTQCGNPYHVIEWGFHDFAKLIAKYFTIESKYVQRITLKSDIIKYSIFHRLKRKFIKTITRDKPVMEKFNDQYPVKDMIAGYQVLVCKSK